MRPDYFSALAEAQSFAQKIHAYINSKEHKNMSTLTAPRATAETVTVEKLQLVKTEEKQFLLRLSEQQAGYLIDLLWAHVGGDVAAYVLVPLGYALKDAGAERIRAKNAGSAYAAFRHATLEFTDDAAREAAGAPKKVVY